MAARVAINGFGRIGRNMLRAGLEQKDYEIVAVNDLTDADTLAHLLRHDSIHGAFPRKVAVDGDNLVLSGINLQLVSGSGTTAGLDGSGCSRDESCGSGICTEDRGCATINGLGNLIIGYDEKDYDDVRTGSHNVVVGPFHSYDGYGAIVAGENNSVSGASSSITGGRDNTTEQGFASVCGGTFNRALGVSSSVTGGIGNVAQGFASSVSGGDSNRTTGRTASIAGGAFNRATAASSVVVGGRRNSANGQVSVVLGREGFFTDSPRDVVPR